MKRISDDIKSGNFKKVYLLYGDETYFRQLAKQKLKEALIPENDSMNLTVFSGKACDERSIIEICDTLPFFSERRAVVVEDSGFFKEKHDRITDYIKNIPDYLTLIFSESSVDKRGSLYKQVAKTGTACEFTRLKADELSSWLLVLLKKSGKKIRKADMDTFISYVGDDAGTASNEMEKLICYTGSRDEIRKEDIEAVCVRSLEDRIFEMLTDMTMGRRREALSKYSDMLLMKEEPMRILYMMGRQYYQLLKIKELSKEGFSEKKIAEIAGIHPYAVKKGIPVCRHYTLEDLRRTVEEFVRTEEDVKTGRISGRLAAELILLRV